MMSTEMIRDFGIKGYIHLSKELPHSQARPWTLVCTIPYNCHFQPRIRAEGPKGGSIRFNSSNPLVGYLTPTETVEIEPGERTYEAKNWVSGEGAIYTIPAGVTVKSVDSRTEPVFLCLRRKVPLAVQEPCPQKTRARLLSWTAP